MGASWETAQNALRAVSPDRRPYYGRQGLGCDPPDCAGNDVDQAVREAAARPPAGSAVVSPMFGVCARRGTLRPTRRRCFRGRAVASSRGSQRRRPPQRGHCSDSGSTSSPAHCRAVSCARCSPRRTGLMVGTSVIDVRCAEQRAGLHSVDVVAGADGSIRRADHSRWASEGTPPAPPVAPRRVPPHHIVSPAGRWYLVGWDVDRADWRTFRVDPSPCAFPTAPTINRATCPATSGSAASSPRNSRARPAPTRGRIGRHPLSIRRRYRGGLPTQLGKEFERISQRSAPAWATQAP